MTETTKRTTKVWAHRGASGYRPENTLEAFELAIRQGADGIELDVHTSADGELIVMHDENVDRVTDGTGLIKDNDTGSIERIKSQYTRRTIGNLSHSNSGRSTGAHAHHRYDGKHRTKEQHLLLSGNGRENPETGKRNEHGRPADLFLL